MITGTMQLWPSPAPYLASDGFEPYLDFAPWPQNPTGAFVIVCPGGGYTHRAHHEGMPVAEWLTTLGIASAVLHYRVAPARFPAALADVRRALRLVRKNAPAWGIDANRVGTLGFSAGGHLSAYAAAGPEETGGQTDLLEFSGVPNLAVICYGLIHMDDVRGNSYPAPYLLGANHLPLQVEYLAPENYVTPATPPFFLWHTAQDTVVPARETLSMARTLFENGVSVEAHVFQLGGHGMGLAQESPLAKQWPALCATWLEANGFARV